MTIPSSPKILPSHEALSLAKEVGGAVFDRSDSFRDDNIGSDLAYLLIAIIDNDGMSDVDWTRASYGGDSAPAIQTILEEAFPPLHRVWSYIAHDRPE